MKTRRSQTPIMIRSDKAAALLARHVRPGRSQAAVIEEALEQFSREQVPDIQAVADTHTDFRTERVFEDDAKEETYRKLMAISERGRHMKRKYASMEDFDAHEYDERGNLR